MKTLVTHIRPHLDDICAFWLLQRLVPALKDSPLKFVPTATMGGTDHDDENTVCVGVGRGKYDEHKGDVGDCSTSLVWKDIKGGAGLSADDAAAHQMIVDYVLEVDLGKLKGQPWGEFSVVALLDGWFDSHGQDSETLTRYGYDILDTLLVVMRGEVHLQKAYNAGTAFDSKWGPGIAVDNAPKAFDGFAYARGKTIAVIMNHGGTYHSIRARADSAVDLTGAYDTVHAFEPEASWYLHHSKKMLICGGTGGVPAKVASKLTLEQLTELVAKK